MMWLQIEDFVEVFNRLYVAVDLSMMENAIEKRFLSSWIPGDIVAGEALAALVVS